MNDVFPLPSVKCPSCDKWHPILLIPVDGAIICTCGAVMFGFVFYQTENGPRVRFKWRNPERARQTLSSYVKEQHKPDDKTLWWEIPADDETPLF